MSRLSDGPFGPRGARLADLTDAELEAEVSRRRSLRAKGADRPPATEARRRLGRRELLRYYANLELDPGAPLAEVKAAYARLRAKYEPSRYASDPARQRTAQELVASLTEAFDALSEHLGTRG